MIKPPMPAPSDMGTRRLLALQLTAPVPEALQRQAVALAVIALRQLTQPPSLEMPGDGSGCSSGKRSERCSVNPASRPNAPGSTQNRASLGCRTKRAYATSLMAEQFSLFRPEKFPVDLFRELAFKRHGISGLSAPVKPAYGARNREIPCIFPV